MLGRFLFWILPILLISCILVWYLTSTKHEDVPLILVLLGYVIGFVPILGWIIFFGFLWVFSNLKDDGTIQLKNNWFNRTFLAYHAK